jgi:hypothetical protein
LLAVLAYKPPVDSFFFEMFVDAPFVRTDLTKPEPPILADSRKNLALVGTCAGGYCSVKGSATETK